MPNRLQGGAEVMKLEVVVTSAKVIKCSFLLQCAKTTFNSNPGNPIHTENPSLANQSSFGKENRFIKTRELRSFHGAEQRAERGQFIREFPMGLDHPYFQGNCTCS